MPNFFVLRLGKNSVDDIRALDRLTTSPAPPLTITFRCKQVPTEATIGSIVFIWLGSDNNKGQPTEWKRGLRALGKLTSKGGGPGRNNEWTLGVDIPIVLAYSSDRQDLLNSAPAAYSDFSSVPILGLPGSSQQAVQLIQIDKPMQDVGAILYTLAQIQPTFQAEAVQKFPELLPYFAYAPKGMVVPSGQQGVATGNSVAAQIGSLSALVNDAHSDFLKAKFIVDRSLVHRFIAALMAKHFVILTGLSGSGKTKLAQAFAKWITPNTNPLNYVILAVGPDWTNSDAVLGYPDALNPGSYGSPQKICNNWS